ncbi:MAG: hypothetical protein ACK4EX_11635, partial [Thermaurantimonas sp.]|uniref:hypothetical protein n=1 Tax=Thermaurantimonas sp. TaxID=2681568 RepID=UPI00391AF509
PHLCTFWHAVERKKYGIPVIIENPNEIWDKILNDKDKYPQSFLEKLPKDKWRLQQYFQPNEIFFIPNSDKKLKYNDCLYRLQKMSIKGNGQLDIWFRQIFETQIIDNKLSSKSQRFFNVQSIGALEKLNPQKISVNRLGEIVA